MTIEPFYDGFKKQKRKMRVAGFMSGSGTNIRKILENQYKLGAESPYELVFLFSNITDPKRCRIREIAEEYNLEFEINNLRDFYDKKGVKDRRNLEIRREYDQTTVDLLKERDIDGVVLGGYMAIITDVIFNNFTTINVHPADLSIIDPITKKRKYTGDHAVRAVHIVTEEIDGGPIILISKPVKVKLPKGIKLEDLKDPKNSELLEKISDEHQDKLKQIGDWKIFPKALEYIARGFLEHDENLNLYFKGKPIPMGIRL
ncbi:MAG: phosphoribosylglycinamide formyltransferase [Candidatus Helarchaeota archaeon]